jgi:hypothetical protein
MHSNISYFVLYLEARGMAYSEVLYQTHRVYYCTALRLGPNYTLFECTYWNYTWSGLGVGLSPWKQSEVQSQLVSPE